MTFKEIINSVKDLLKEHLTADNTEFISKVDKELDNLSTTHEETEKELSSVKDKLVDVVKNTSFKKEDSQEEDVSDTKGAMSLDEAIESSLKEIQNQRKENK